MKKFIIIILLFIVGCTSKKKNEINLHEKLYKTIYNEHFENKIIIEEDTLVIEIHSNLSYVDSSFFVLLVDYLLNEINASYTESEFLYFKFLYFTSIEKRYKYIVETKNITAVILPFNHSHYRKMTDYLINKLWLNKILDYTKNLYVYYNYLNLKKEEQRSFTTVAIEGFNECLYNQCDGICNTILKDLLTFYTDKDLDFNEEKANELRELIKLIQSANPNKDSNKKIEI